MEAYDIGFYVGVALAFILTILLYYYSIRKASRNNSKWLGLLIINICSILLVPLAVTWIIPIIYLIKKEKKNEY